MFGAVHGDIPEHIRKFCDIKLDSTIRLTIGEFEKRFGKPAAGNR